MVKILITISLHGNETDYNDEYEEKTKKRENGEIIQNRIFKIKSWTIFLVLRRFNWRLSDYNESNFLMIYCFESEVYLEFFINY